jgi:uncharacterized RDD family membrane protein YckC
MQSPPPLPPVNPYAAPSARLEDQQVGSLILADRGQRLGAAIIDMIAFYGVLFVAVMLVGIFASSFVNEKTADSMVIPIIIVVIVGLAILAIALVNLRLVILYGQTIGKRLLDIRMVRTDGSPLAAVRFIFARWLPTTVLSGIPGIGWLFFLIDTLLIFSADQRCLHDLIADTIVVKN